MSDIEKFVSTLSSFFDNIGIIIDDLNKRGYQQLSPQQIEIMKTYVLSKTGVCYSFNFGSAHLCSE